MGNSEVWVNGKRVDITGIKGGSIVISGNGSITIDGKDVVGDSDSPKIEITITGDVTGDVQVERGTINCKSVGGKVKAGGSVTCEDVKKSVTAGGSVKCSNVEGNVTASGSVKCGNVGGNVRASGSISKAFF